MAGSVSGTSVLGIEFDSGVIIAADTCASYGSMAMFRDVNRLIKVNEFTVAGASGDLADFQFLSSVIEQMQIEEDADGDNDSISPRALFTWLTRYLYNRRCKFNPVFNVWAVGGIEENTGKPFLGYVDMNGTAYKDSIVTTGYGSYMAKPLMRAALEAKNGQPLTEAEARTILHKSMEVLYARDARSWPNYHLAVVKKDAQGKVTSKVEDKIQFDIDWTIAECVREN